MDGDKPDKPYKGKPAEGARVVVTEGPLTLDALEAIARDAQANRENTPSAVYANGEDAIKELFA